MRYSVILKTLFVAAIGCSSALEIKRKMLNLRQESTSPPPLTGPPPGVPLGQWINEKLQPKNPAVPGKSPASKRQLAATQGLQHSEEHGLQTTSWDAEKVHWNISILASSCPSAVKLTTKFGGYLFTTGDYKNDVTADEIITDISGFAIDIDPFGSYQDQVLANLDLLIKELGPLYDRFVCKPAVTNSIEAPDLRKLLTVGEWVALLFDSAVGGTIGAGVAAGTKASFGANITTEALVEVGLIVAGTTMAVNLRRTVAAQEGLGGENTWPILMWTAWLYYLVENVKRKIAGQPLIGPAASERARGVASALVASLPGQCTNPSLAEVVTQNLPQADRVEIGLQMLEMVEQRIAAQAGPSGQC